jgi:type II secretory pathway component PulM
VDFAEAVRSFWEARSARERAVLAAAAVLAVSAALYGLVWEPGLKASARLAAVLPRLRAQVEDMRLQQKEIVLLRKTSVAVSGAADLRALLRASAARGPFAGTAHSLEWEANDRVRFSAAAADFDRWLQWVGSVQRELGIRVQSCSIAALGEPGMVRIQASFVSGQ